MVWTTNEDSLIIKINNSEESRYFIKLKINEVYNEIKNYLTKCNYEFIGIIFRNRVFRILFETKIKIDNNENEVNNKEEYLLLLTKICRVIDQGIAIAYCDTLVEMNNVSSYWIILDKDYKNLEKKVLSSNK